MKVKRLLTYFVACALMIGISSFLNESQAAPSKSTYSKTSIKRKIIQEARRQGLSPHLALSVAKQESNFNAKARSHVGAIGLFQLMPQTAKDLGVNPYNVDQNIRGGIKYLKQMKSKFGSTRLALAAYNAGPGAVQKYKGVPPYRETREYVRRIMNYYNQYRNTPTEELVSR